MMQISIMVPLFTVPAHASHKRIIQQIVKFTGFQSVKIYEINYLPQSQPKMNQQLKGKLVAQIEGLKLSFSNISILGSKIAELQRENNMLRKDLAQLYKKYQEQIRKYSNKQMKTIQKQSQKIQSQPDNQHKINACQQVVYEEEVKCFQKQISKLVSQKKSKEEIIQKLSFYCQFLIKLIEQKKLSIF